jgi:hypothetical protein
MGLDAPDRGIIAFHSGPDQDGVERGYHVIVMAQIADDKIVGATL